MERRISLTVNPEDIEPDEAEIAPNVSGAEEAATMPPSSAASPRQDDIARLFHSGVVTHQIRNPDAMDPLFAVSQLRDLPEVRFAAAFHDGLLLLGCPDGPPESIADMVELVTQQPAPAQPSPEIDRKLDQLSARLEDFKANQERQLAPALQHLGSVSGQLDFLVDALAPDTAKAADQQENASLESLQALLQELVQKSEGLPALERLETSVTGLTEGAEQQRQNIQETLETLKSALEQPMEEAETTTSQSPDFEAISSDICSRLEPKLDSLTALVTDMHDVIQVAKPNHDPTDPGNAVADAINALTARMESGSDQSEQHAAVQAQLNEIMNAIQRTSDTGEAVASLQNQFEALPSKSQIDSAFSKFEGELSKIAEQSETAAQQSQASIALLKRAAERDTVKTITQKLDALTEQSAKADEQPLMMDEIKGLGAQIEGLNEQVADLKAATTPGEATLENALGEKLDRLAENVSARSEPLDYSDYFSSLETHMQALHEVLTTQTTAGNAQAFEQGLSNLREEVVRLAEKRPEAVVDLTEQRRGFAAFTTAMSKVVQRFESSLDRMDANGKDATVVSATDILERLDRLPNEISEALPPAADISPIEACLEGVKNTVERLATPVDMMVASMEAISTAGRARLGELKETLDQISAHISDDAAQRVDLTPVLDQLETFADHLRTVPNDISALQTELAKVTTRPAPQLDLTAQRDGFARFGTALATVIARLENVIESVGQQSSDEERAAQDVKAIVQALPMVLKEAMDTAPLLQAIGDIREGLVPLHNDLAGLSGVPAGIDALMQRPDPVIDLTEQRRSFARFGTALAMVVSRLESVAEQICAIEAEDIDLTPLIAGMDAIAQDVTALFVGQDDQTAWLIEEFSKLRANPAPPVVHEKEAIFASSRQSMGDITLDEMRYLFAEMVATQIMRNATCAKAPITT